MGKRDGMMILRSVGRRAGRSSKEETGEGGRFSRISSKGVFSRDQGGRLEKAKVPSPKAISYELPNKLIPMKFIHVALLIAIEESIEYVETAVVLSRARPSFKMGQTIK